MRGDLIEIASELGHVATFNPQLGLRLCSLRYQGIEAIVEESTFPVAPRFGERHPQLIVPPPPELAWGGKGEPFPHGIAAHAPWRDLEVETHRIEAALRGSEEWCGTPLKELEGQNFLLRFEALFLGERLRFLLSCVSDTDSLVGYHCCCRLPKEAGYLEADDLFCETFTAESAVDRALRPSKDPCSEEITLTTSEYLLTISYSCCCVENCWHLHKVEGTPFLAIAPLSSRDPKRPHLSVSSIAIDLTLRAR